MTFTFPRDTTDTAELAPARRAVAQQRRLPGKARPRAEALREYQDHTDKVRERIDERWGEHPVMVRFLRDVHAPDSASVYRWRVELDCGCVKEVLTSGKDRLPTDRQWRDLHSDDLLPPGQIICLHAGGHINIPYREITEWCDRRQDLPPQPTEPPDYWAHLPDVWAKVRRDEPRAQWGVMLACGHSSTVTVEDRDWKPADGPIRREVTAEELAEHLARLDGDADVVDSEVVDHAKRWWADGCPEPAPDTMCFTCRRARQIVGYQRVGWLAQPPRPPKAPAAPSRASLERRLRDVERQAAELRDQLSRLDDTEPEGTA